MVMRKFRSMLPVAGPRAAKANISQPYLHDLENGNRGAKRETLERIAKALNVEVEDLTVNS